MDFLKLDRARAQKMKLDIYLLAGQSNCSGATQIAKAPEAVRDHNEYENVRFYYDRTDADGTVRYYRKDFCAVREGLGFDEGELVNDIPAAVLAATKTPFIGPELGMARVLNDKYAADDRCAVIIKCACGATSMRLHEPLEEDLPEIRVQRFRAFGSWYPSALPQTPSDDPSRPSGYLTRTFKKMISDTYAALLDAGFAKENIRYCALCWMQGESDRLHAEEYAQYFPFFTEEVRSHLSAATGDDYDRLPIVMGEISETFRSAEPSVIEDNRRFIATQHALAEKDGAITVIPTAKFALNRWENGADIALGTDNFHWSYADMLSVGELFGKTAYDISHIER